MKHLLQELDALERRDSDWAQAVANIRQDIAEEGNSHGNLGAEIVASMDGACEVQLPMSEVVSRHIFLERPEFHRSAAVPGRVCRAMSRSDFVTYHLLDGAADLSEADAWKSRLASGSLHALEPSDFKGWTSRSDAPCWWTFEEEGRPFPDQGHIYAEQLALGANQRRKAKDDQALVEVTLPGPAAARRYFKPTALEGFGPETPFRPELSGAEHGRTMPRDPTLEGWPEVVSESSAYLSLPDDETEIGVRVLPYETR